MTGLTCVDDLVLVAPGCAARRPGPPRQGRLPHGRPTRRQASRDRPGEGSARERRVAGEGTAQERQVAGEQGEPGRSREHDVVAGRDGQGWERGWVWRSGQVWQRR
ncbi:hypothetical protein [Streptomyces sp. NPDC093598]|uniref:hypothetical protein n=1 Tax=Streptomyces sp. NPDC093598 TaxID=3366046 RepID=UPI00380F522B